jgi:hypothetical protein
VLFPALTLLLAVLMTACGSGNLSAPSGVPVADPEAFVASLRAATLPGAPRQITFGWRLDEQGSRVSGRGVVRAEAPERLRLDLFGERGDTYLTAALVGDEYRLPPEAVNAVALPSPSLFWAALGVLRLPAGATLLSATTTENTADLRYQSTDGQIYVWSFTRSSAGTWILTRLERAGPRGVIETVSVDHSAESSALTRTSYRDWTAFRELILTIEEARDANSFPPDIWRPDAR